ncbi:MAG: hypothetical protein ACTHL1_09555 [Burkholderiaceae bacterium]
MNLLNTFSGKSGKVATIENRSRADNGDWLFEEYREQIVDLLYRVDDALARRKKRIVEFISPGVSEGTTSIAWGYARAAAQMLRRRVLLLTNDTGLGGNGLSGPQAGGNTILIDDMASSTSIVEAIGPAGDQPFVATVLMDDAFSRENAAGSIEDGLWQRLYEHFDEIVIDSPAPSVSHLGRLLASYADGVVIVLEAEKTRDPVAKKLIDDLYSVQANIIGTVLNKRRYYVPNAIYDKL